MPSTTRTRVASNSVTDIILSNIPAFDVDALFGYGTHPSHRVHDAPAPHASQTRIRSRSFRWDVLLHTLRVHFAHAPGAVPVPAAQRRLGSAARALSLWRRPTFSPGTSACAFSWRSFSGATNSFAICSLHGRCTCRSSFLLGHYHYSIDVASAYFITYTIYVLCVKFFPKSLAIFNSDPVPLP